MRITMKQEVTVRELLDQIGERYGQREKLEAYVRTHPRDLVAKAALHDLREYCGADPRKIIRETKEVIIPDHAIDQLTVQRLQLLLTLKSSAGRVPSVRSLARMLKRDIKNVSEDVEVLRRMGLVEVEEQGRGKPRRVALPAKSIDLHLVEADG